MTAKTSTRPSPLDAYLEWQAEIGAAEVVMPSPWVKAPRAAAKTPNDAMHAEDAPHEAFVPSRSTASSSKAASAATASAPEDFFRDIQKRLAEPSRKPVAPKVAPIAASPAPRPVSSVPAFASLEEYWDWLATQYARWFPALAAPQVRAAGSAGSKLAVVELSPVGETPFAGAPGALLDKMMQAIGLAREALYLTSVMKAPLAGKTWARKDIALALPSFLAELRLAGCDTVLLLGEGCAQALLRTGKSLAALESVEVAAADGKDLAFVAAWHPADLLRDATLKAPTWARLKNLKTTLDRSQGNPS